MQSGTHGVCSLQESKNALVMLTLAFILSLPRTCWGKLRLKVYVSCASHPPKEGWR